MSNAKTTIGLIHPGAMGASVGAAAKTLGARVIWASQGRSTATQSRAEKAGLEDCQTLAELVARSDIIFSICPPHSAREVAQSVVNLGFNGLYLEANAIAPDVTREIEILLTSCGAD